MKDGRMSEVGSYTELLSNNAAFAEFLRNYLTNPENVEDISDSEGMYISDFESFSVLHDIQEFSTKKYAKVCLQSRNLLPSHFL